MLIFFFMCLLSTVILLDFSYDILRFTWLVLFCDTCGQTCGVFCESDYIIGGNCLSAVMLCAALLKKVFRKIVSIRSG